MGARKGTWLRRPAGPCFTRRYTLGYERLISLIDPGSLASRRVAEKVDPTPEKEVRVYAIHKGNVA